MRDSISKNQKLEIIRTITCQYTITPNRQFILSPLKQHPDIFVTLGAAPAFIFAPVIRCVKAELAVDGTAMEDLSKPGILLVKRPV